VVVRAQAYVAAWQSAFSTVVIEEQLTQRASSGRGPDARQTTRADLLLLRQPARGTWLSFRDVYEVNGRAVRDHDDRLRKLFLESPSTALDDAARIANESSRYNIGTVIRNIDVPTFGLALLAPGLAERVTFRTRGDALIDGVPTWRIDYREHQRPTIVRTLRNASVPLEGSLWIEPSSGRVVRTLVKTEGTPDPGVRLPPPSGATLMWVQVTYGPNPTVGFWVPARMDEIAVSADRSTVEVAAVYSNVRRFQVETTEVVVPR
jgi:hypothetical protein